MKTNGAAIRSVTVSLALVTLLSCTENSEGQEKCQYAEERTEAASGQANQDHQTGSAANGSITIKERWELPGSLLEISGIAIYGSRLACVQDEDGKIYLFNPATGKVEAEKTFAGPGDYEGIAIVEEAAWVLRADGQLFEVRGFDSDKPETRVHETPLTVKQDTEGLTADLANKRLLISVKGKDPDSKDYKGVYAYDLSTGKLMREPVYKIAVSSDVNELSKKKKKKATTIRPSDIALHPQNGDLYVLDGPGAALLVLAKDGSLKQQYPLEKSDFPQPEGIAFAPDGGLYISNEGRGGTATILKVTLD